MRYAICDESNVVTNIIEWDGVPLTECEGAAACGWPIPPGHTAKQAETTPAFIGLTYGTCPPPRPPEE